MKRAKLDNRAVIAVEGEDRVAFLQGLVSNDVAGPLPVYAFLLTPQGKFLFDLFIHDGGDRLLIDCEASRRDDLLKTLAPYKLRSKISMSVSDEKVYAEWEGDDGHPADPRHPKLGARYLSAQDLEETATAEDYRRLRFALGIAENSGEIKVGDDTLADINAAVLNGISWTKGCYMGQELTARMKYRGLAKRQLVPVTGEKLAVGGIEAEGGAGAGEVRAVSADGRLGVAMMRKEWLEKRGGTRFSVQGAELAPHFPKWLAEISE